MTKRLTDAQREQIKANFDAGILPTQNADLVGCSRTTVDDVLVKAGLKAQSQYIERAGVTITNTVEEFRPGQTFWIGQIRAFAWFGVMPDGLTMRLGSGHTAEMMGATLVRDDGYHMQLIGPTGHRWV